MSDVGFKGKGIIFSRLLDVDTDSQCFDDDLNRLAFYRNIINQMIVNGFAISPYTSDEVTNTLHDKIVKFSEANSLKTIFVELNASEFPF